MDSQNRYSKLLGLLIVLAGLSPVLTGTISFESALLLGFAWIIVTLVLMGLTIIRVSRPALQQTVQNLTISFITLSLFLTLFDLVLRAIYPVAIYYHPEAKYQIRYPDMPLITVYQPNLSFDGPMINVLAAINPDPSFRQVRQMRLTTDAYGYSNLESDPTDVDIIVVGDSFGLGSAVDDDKTWAGILRNEYDLSVYNLSIPGAGPWQYYAHTALAVDRLDTHEDTILLWLIFSGDDLDSTYYDILDIDQFPWQTGPKRIIIRWRNFISKSPVGLATKRVWLTLSRSDDIQQAVTSSTLPNGDPVLFYTSYVEQQDRDLEEIRAHENLDNLKAVIAKANQLAQSKGLTFVIVFAPSKGLVYPWLLDGSSPWSTEPSSPTLSQVIEQISRENGICYLDLTPYLISVSQQSYEQSGELLYWYDDTHWSETGNAVVAQWIYDSLCWDGNNNTPCYYIP